MVFLCSNLLDPFHGTRASESIRFCRASASRTFRLSRLSDFARVSPSTRASFLSHFTQNPFPNCNSDDEHTTISHSPITISDDEEEEFAPVRRLPAVRPRQSLVDPQYGGDSDEETPISTTHQAESGQVGGAKTQKRIEFDETECRRVDEKCAAL